MSEHWIQTHNGLAFDIREEPLPFNLWDIAFSLSKQCRYAGQTRWHYSVALHSLCVERALQIEAAKIGWSLDKTVDVAIWALLHDGGEAYLIDIPAPFKRLPEMEGYRKLEAFLDGKLREHFKIDVTQAELDIVRGLDVGMLHPERTDLHTIAPRPWTTDKWIFESCNQAWQEVGMKNCWRPMDEIAYMFIDRYNALNAQREQASLRWTK